MKSDVPSGFLFEPGTAALFSAKIFGVYDADLESSLISLERANRDHLYVEIFKLVTKKYVPTLAAVRKVYRTMVYTETETVLGT